MIRSLSAVARVLFKSFLAFLAGALLSVVLVLLLLTKPFLALLSHKEAGLAVIVLLPVAIVYMIGAGLVGGIAGILVYYLVRFFRRKRTR